MERPVTGAAPQLLRTLNARSVLRHAWAADEFTASDVMSRIGLSRSTAIDVCDELMQKGWLIERSDGGARATKGRPARRYALNESAGAVVGVDAGFERMSATVADLRGRPLARAVQEIPAPTPQSWDRLADARTRLDLARHVVDEALGSAGVAAERVLAITVGVPAPVDPDGVSPVDGIGFWQLVNPGYRPVFADSAPIVRIENDANLAAIAEGWSEDGRGRGVDSYIAMLVGEGIGTGLMIDGRLVRGRRGGAGEMRFLDRVEGVGSTEGLALLARVWATEEILSGTLPSESLLRQLDPHTLHESDVERAAEAGDETALRILERLAVRLARICLVLGDLLDVDLVVVGGAAASTLPVVVQRAAELIASSHDPTAPRLLASVLGGAVVTTGAVAHALALVQEQALDLLPGTRDVA